MLKKQLLKVLDTNPRIFCSGDSYIYYISWDDVRYNFQALILKTAGYSLQTANVVVGGPSVRLPLNAPAVHKQWMEFEEKIGIEKADTREIPALTRQVWAAEYGDDEALALPLYDLNSGIPGTMWWDNVAEVEACDFTAFLMGAMPYKLNRVPKRSR